MKPQRLTVEQFRALTLKQDKAMSRNSKNKYGAKKTGGHDSKREHNRASALQLKQRAGLISNLREQVRFILIPSQHDADGNLVERQCAYIADFVYNLPDGSLVVEDTKGFRTPEYIIKRKLMLCVHGIRIKEI